MWDPTRHKSPQTVEEVAAAQAKKLRSRRKVRLIRSRAEIVVVGKSGEPLKTIVGQAILSDLEPTEIVLFSASELLPQEQVTLTIEQPQRFFIAGEVVLCRPFQLENRIVQENPLLFRVTIKFCFHSEDEARLVKEYCEELSKKGLRNAA